MNKTHIKIYYILTFLFVFTLFYLNDIIELFTVSVTHEQESTLNENNTENIITNIVSSDLVSNDVVSPDHINSPSSLKETDFSKSVSLRNDKEFQESIARMKELIEYSRSNEITAIPEKIDINPIVNLSRTELLNVNNRESHPFSYNYFDDGLDVKLNDKSRLHIDENSHITVCNECSVNIDDSSVNVDDEDTESDKTVISNTQITLDWNEDEVFEYPDSDSESYIGHSSSQHLPPQEYASTNVNIHETDLALQAFLDKTDKYIDKSNVPALKSSYTNAELGLGRSHIPSRPNTDYMFPSYSRFSLYQQSPPPSGIRSQAIDSNLPLMEQITSSGENTYAKSYLGSLNDPDLNRIIGVSSENSIDSDDTINTNEVDKDKESTTTTTTTTTSTNTNNSRKNVLHYMEYINNK